MRKKQDRNLRNLIKCIIRTKVSLNEGRTDGVALYLSGGVDSMTLGFLCNEMGFKVTAYCFEIDNNVTADSSSARRACNMFGWDLKIINVPSENLYDDFKRLTKLGCRKKTHYECTWPMLYLFPETKEKYIFGGYGADILYGLSKQACMHYKHTIDLLNDYRAKRFADDNPNGVRQREKLARRYGKVLVEPYMDPIMPDYFKDKTWDDCNQPVQKAIVLREFPEFKNFGRRPHVNYQLLAKIPEYFETLLAGDLNFNKRTRIIDLCRDHYELAKSKGDAK